MTFIHQDPDFEQLLAIVARDTGIAESLIEKDYWVTHTLWALQQTGLDIWFKGGTSLSKAFGIIERFSEDLDLVILPGSIAGLPEVKSWTSTNRGRVRQRYAYYEALTAFLVVPDVRIKLDKKRIDARARNADYLCYYPSVRLVDLPSYISPFVRLEVGHARVIPHVRRSFGSFAHDYLEKNSMLGEYQDNRPYDIRCVHPVVTLIEKLDAISRRYCRDPFEPESFVRHYEDAARIIESLDRIPTIENKIDPQELTRDILENKDIRNAPGPQEPALLLDEKQKRIALEKAYNEIYPMFWGRRMPLSEACSTIRSWLEESLSP